MNVALETIQVPKQLYLRLWRLAEREKTEPVQLIEQWLESVLPQDDDATEDSVTEPIAPIYYLHAYAEDLGVADLAQNIDHYLYGHEKQ